MENTSTTLVLLSDSESNPTISCEHRLYVTRVHPEARLPALNKHNHIGLDLYSVSNISINPFSQALVSTGIAIQTPNGTYGRIETVHEMGTRGVHVNASIVDCQYTGTLMVLLSNLTRNLVTINKTVPIAQLVLQSHVKCEVVEVSKTQTVRPPDSVIDPSLCS